jgi:hypothetical protein
MHPVKTRSSSESGSSLSATGVVATGDGGCVGTGAAVGGAAPVGDGGIVGVTTMGDAVAGSGVPCGVEGAFAGSGAVAVRLSGDGEVGRVGDSEPPGAVAVRLSGDGEVGRVGDNSPGDGSIGAESVGEGVTAPDAAGKGCAGDGVGEDGGIVGACATLA